jgi:signal transduction histidine kinase
MLAPDELRARALRRVLSVEAWRNERVINFFRGCVWVAVGAVEYLQRSAVGPDHLTIMPVLYLGWGACVLVLNLTWLRRRFYGWVPVLLTLCDIVVVTVGVRAVYLHNLVAHETAFAAREVTRAGLGLLLVVAVNMVRFSWRSSMLTGVAAAAAYLYLRLLTHTLAGENVTDLLIFSGLVGLLAYTTRRFRAILERVMVDLRRIQEERVASLSGIVAGVAHEVNTPLGVLRSNAQVFDSALSIVRAAMQDDTRGGLFERHPKLARALSSLESLDVASGSALQRISTVVQSLRSFAHLDEAETTRFDVRQGVARDTESRIKVSKDYGEVPSIEGRPAQINQALMHVLRNAVQAIDEQGCIDVKLRTEDGQLLLQVSDTGRGITREQLAHLFYPVFSRAGKRVRMGFGLSTTYSIVQDHGGSIEIDSELGRGTTVSIRLPIG